MLRVLFVTNSLAHGGAERHTITLSNRLAERGHECHTVFVKNNAAQLGRVVLRSGGTVRSLEARRYLDGRALTTFARTIAAIDPTVIVAANEYSLLYATVARRLSGARPPLVVTYHATRLLGAKEEIQMLAYRPLFWAAACAVFVCDRQRRHWRNRGVCARRNEVIHNGVDTEEFVDRLTTAERSAVRTACGFEAADYVIGISAGLRPEKNHTQLVDAVARLRASGIPARALLIGDGETRGVIEARARSLGIAEHVRILGFRPDVRPYVLACDTAVLCSVTEALSLAAIEAMALGKPIVHADVGGAAELITPGTNGHLFPVNDTDALVARLALLVDRPLRERMGREARATVERSFAEATMIDRYEALLLELVGRLQCAA